MSRKWVYSQTLIACSGSYITLIKHDYSTLINHDCTMLRGEARDVMNVCARVIATTPIAVAIVVAIRKGRKKRGLITREAVTIVVTVAKVTNLTRSTTKMTEMTTITNGVTATANEKVGKEKIGKKEERKTGRKRGEGKRKERLVYYNIGNKAQPRSSVSLL